MKKIVRGFSQNGCISRSGFLVVLSRFSSSRLGAAALLVQFDLVLEPVVQFEVVVLQGGGGA